MSSSNSPKVLGLVSMIPATSSSSTACNASTSTQPRPSLGTVTTSNPARVTEAGLVPCAESGMTTLCRVAPLAPCQARMSRRPVSSPAAPGGRLHGGGGHPGDLAQGGLELDEKLEPALDAVGGRGRMDIGEAGERGDRVADLGVVLHGARAQGVGAQIDGELAVAQAGEVSHQIAFGHLGEVQRDAAAMGFGNELVERGLGDAGGAQLPRAAPRLRQLEEGGLGVASEQWRAGGAPARRGRRDEVVDHHRTAFSKVETKASISARVRRSVTATRRPSGRPWA